MAASENLGRGYNAGYGRQRSSSENMGIKGANRWIEMRYDRFLLWYQALNPFGRS